jgi:glycogen debranching enzyme
MAARSKRNETDDIALTKDQYYILTRSSLADETRLILKHADTFLITDRHGDIRPLGFEDHGLFSKETRFLSRLILRLEGQAPPLLSSAVTEDNDTVSVDLTNPDFEARSGRLIKSGTIYLNRSIFLWRGCYYEHIRISNYGLVSLQFSLSFEFEADFVDIFEIRGLKRKARGRLLDPIAAESRVILPYKGRDDTERRTRIEFSPKPDLIAADRARFSVWLGPHQEEDFYLTVSCEAGRETAINHVFGAALGDVKKSYQKRREEMCVVETSNAQFNDWLSRSCSDLYMMLTETRYGLYPYAGIPWYNTVFGRDGIISALETLWLYPDIGRGVLGYLSAAQATELNAEQDAEPGKILHEERHGEMAVCREIPFWQYYGTVDATPLYIALAGYYYECTGDLDFISRIWPNITAALAWIDDYGDQDGDGFIEYSQHSTRGLGNQGWKDSGDSVFHADGRLAASPIALCEVQGYVYEAKMKGAMLASALGMEEVASKWSQEADALRRHFQETFWCDELGTYALALDREKRPCMIRSSNAGHCLFSGIADDEHARLIARQLVGESFFTGWGVRTIATTEARYNPMSYHNGSVWPHDNAMAAFGAARYRMKDVAVKILTGLFDTSVFVHQSRLPELFCGFDRSPGAGPTLYPVACEPQSWASGAVFLLLQACFGIRVVAREKKIVFDYPVLPPFLNEVTLRNLKVGPASLDIALTRYGNDVGINVIRKEGTVELVVVK